MKKKKVERKRKKPFAQNSPDTGVPQQYLQSFQFLSMLGCEPAAAAAADGSTPPRQQPRRAAALRRARYEEVEDDEVPVEQETAQDFDNMTHFVVCGRTVCNDNEAQAASAESQLDGELANTSAKAGGRGNGELCLVKRMVLVRVFFFFFFLVLAQSYRTLAKHFSTCFWLLACAVMTTT